MEPRPHWPWANRLSQKFIRGLRLSLHLKGNLLSWIVMVASGKSKLLVVVYSLWNKFDREEIGWR
jgi:hypothetical protein